jgi:hypothetical protein
MAFPAPAEPPSTSLPLPHPEAYPGEPREYARALMQRKDEIEAEMVSILPRRNETDGGRKRSRMCWLR